MLQAYCGVVVGIPKQQWNAHPKNGCIVFDFETDTRTYRLGIKGDVGGHAGFIGQDSRLECTLPADANKRTQSIRIYVAPKHIRKAQERF